MFVKEVRGNIRPLVRAENVHATCVPAVPCHMLHPWYQNIGRSIFNWQARALTEPLPHSPFEPELALNAKRSSVLRNINGQRALLWTCRLMFPTLTTRWSSKGCPRRKEKNRPMWHSFHFFPALLYSSASWREGLFLEYVHLEMWNNNSQASLVQCLHCAGKNRIHVHLKFIRYRSFQFQCLCIQVKCSGIYV